MLQILSLIFLINIGLASNFKLSSKVNISSPFPNVQLVRFSKNDYYLSICSDKACLIYLRNYLEPMNSIKLTSDNIDDTIGNMTFAKDNQLIVITGNKKPSVLYLYDKIDQYKWRQYPIKIVQTSIDVNYLDISYQNNYIGLCGLATINNKIVSWFQIWKLNLTNTNISIQLFVNRSLATSMDDPLTIAWAYNRNLFEIGGEGNQFEICEINTTSQQNVTCTSYPYYINQFNKCTFFSKSHPQIFIQIFEFSIVVYNLSETELKPQKTYSFSQKVWYSYRGIQSVNGDMLYILSVTRDNQLRFFIIGNNNYQTFTQFDVFESNNYYPLHQASNIFGDYVLYNEQTGQIQHYSICPINKFYSSINKECTDCLANCQFCNQGNNCMKCTQGYFFEKTCTHCSYGCKQCSEWKYCNQCYDGYLKSNGVCHSWGFVIVVVLISLSVPTFAYIVYVIYNLVQNKLKQRRKNQLIQQLPPIEDFERI